MQQLLWHRREILSSSLFFLIIFIGFSAYGNASSSHVREDSSGDAALLEGLFHEAARDARVPVVLLEAIATVETGMKPARRHGGCGAERTVGVMALRADGQRGATLSAASSASGIPMSLLAVESEANIRGAAAWLRSRVPLDTDSEDLLAWWDAVAAYGGGEGTSGAYFAAEVYAVILSGKEVRLPDGTVYEVPPHILAAIEERVADVRLLIQSSPDYSGADYVPACSENYTWANRGVGDITYVIIHTAQGGYSGTVNWFANCSASVSAHYVISKSGEITQSLLEKHIGWHAGYWPHNELSIGIEHEGFVDDPTNYTEAMYQASAALVANICEKYDIPKDRFHIIGHNEVPGCPYSGGGQGCHTDPGDYWDWDLFMAYVGGEEDPAEGGEGGGGDVLPPQTGDLVGFIRESDIYVGADIAGANVSLSTGEWVTTGGDGYYAFSQIPAGVVSVIASAPGYVTKEETVSVEAGLTNWKSIALDVAPPVESDPVPDPETDPEPDPGSDPDPEVDTDSNAVLDPEAESENEGISSNHWTPGNGLSSGTDENSPTLSNGEGMASNGGCTAGGSPLSRGWWMLFLCFFLPRLVYGRRSVMRPLSAE